MDNNIHADESLFRRVSNIPQYWKQGSDKPSSALFKDSNGVSVNRCNYRCKDEIINDEERLHKLYLKGAPLKAIISVKKVLCEDMLVQYDPEDNNKHHSLILRNEDTIQLTESQAKRLSRNCNIEKTYKF